MHYMCRNVICSSTIGAATPENPEDIPNVALSSQPATAGEMRCPHACLLVSPSVVGVSSYGDT